MQSPFVGNLLRSTLSTNFVQRFASKRLYGTKPKLDSQFYQRPEKKPGTIWFPVVLLSGVVFYTEVIKKPAGGGH